MNKKSAINISLFVITALIIALIVPSYSTFSYKFQLGQTWKGEDIISVVDFPVSKTAQEYNRDVELHIKNYIPIYKLDSTATKNTLNNISQLYMTGAFNDKELSEKGIIVHTAMQKILSRGVIDSSSNLSGKSIIKLTSDGQVSTKSITNLYTLNQAINKLISELKIHNVEPTKEITKITELLIPNIKYSNELNKINNQKEIDRISKTKGFLPRDYTLISKGEKIDSEKLNIINSYKEELYRGGATDFSYMSFFGYLIYVLIIMMMSYMSFKNFRGDAMEKIKNVLFLLMLYIVSISTMSLIINYTSFNPYIIPFMIVPIYVSAFYSSRMSIHQYAYLMLIASIISPNPIEFFAINFLGGIVAIMFIKSSYRRHIILKSATGAMVTFIVVYSCLCLIMNDFTNYVNNVLCLIGNATLVVIFYQFLFLIEKTFGFITNITLFDLCDTNRHLLKDMATKAPGTFQHAIQVANLSETAAKAINANHLLARTGALYHDIGKMINPHMFTENISAGKEPHGGLTPKQSAEVIKNHVTEGIALAKKHNLPQVVIEFIESHHADSLIYYFYRQIVDAEGIENVDEDDFRYPGPKPKSKEASICLICDSIEAASRSLSEYTEESIEQLINTIITNQIKDGLLSESCLEIKDINTIKDSLKNSLMNIFHSRIAYPKR